jgi:hypothetical protein
MSNQRKKGTVTKAGKGKFSYYIVLDDNGFYFNTKFEPKCGEGDVVGIEYEPKGDSRGNVKKITVLQDNSGGYQKANSESSGGGRSSGSGGASSTGGSNRNAGAGNRNESIVFQHSQEMAIRAATIVLAQGAYAVSGKTDAKRLQVEALIDTLTVKFYRDALDPENSNLVKEYRKIESDSKGGDDSSNDEESWDDDEKGGDDDWDSWE